MKKIFAICLICIVSTANANWTQLPEAHGWNVGFDYLATQGRIADNWLAATTAAVTDIRLWVSWQGDDVSQFLSLDIAIQEDVPYNPSTGNPSKPGSIKWSRSISSVEMTPYGTGDEGFFVPFSASGFSSIPIAHDSNTIYQIDISDIETPFTQEAGKVYWLSISASYVATGLEGEYVHPGWVTSANPSLPGAAYVDGGWLPLAYPDPSPSGSEPRHGQPINLAFEIVPEPATICLLGIGALSLINRKK